MKILTGVLLFAMAGVASAQSVDIASTAVSESTSGAQTTTNVNNALTLETAQHRKTEVKTAPGHGLAATTNSFSSDYCGGTVQAGGSGMGFSIGGSRQAFDPNCQALRRAQSFGQQAAHAHNIGQHAMGRNLATMAAWEVCRSNPETAKACTELGLVVVPTKN